MPISGSPPPDSSPSSETGGVYVPLGAPAQPWEYTDFDAHLQNVNQRIATEAPDWVQARLTGRDAVHRALGDAARLLRGERGLAVENSDVALSVRKSLSLAAQEMEKEAEWSAPNPDGHPTLTMWQRAQGFLESARAGMRRSINEPTDEDSWWNSWNAIDFRSWDEDLPHPATSEIVLHQVERADAEALRAAISSDLEAAYVALRAHVQNRPLAQQMVRLARATRDLRSKMPSADGVSKSPNLEVLEDAFSSQNPNDAVSAVESALRELGTTAGRAAFASALQAINGGEAVPSADPEFHRGRYDQKLSGTSEFGAEHGTETWAWRRLAHLEVGLGLESVQSSESAPKFPEGVLAGLGDLSAHLERGEEKPGERVILKNAMAILGTGLPRTPHAVPSTAAQGSGIRSPAYTLRDTLTDWWPGKDSPA